MNAIAPTIRPAIAEFVEAINRHDRDEVMAHIAVDCVIEVPSAAPDGARYETTTDKEQFWDDSFATGNASLNVDSRIAAAEDRAVIRWRAGLKHGLYVVRVIDGKIADLLVYAWD